MNVIRDAVLQAACLWRTAILATLLAISLAGSPAQAAEPVAVDPARLVKLESDVVVLAGKVDNDFALLNAKIDGLQLLMKAQHEALSSRIDSNRFLFMSAWAFFGVIVAYMAFQFHVTQRHLREASDRHHELMREANERHQELMREANNRHHELMQVLTQLLAAQQPSAGAQQFPRQNAQAPKEPQRAAASKKPQRRAVAQRAAL